MPARGRPGRQGELFALPPDLYARERACWARGLLVAGVDEAGRGPLAGPVVAAAVVLDPARPVPGLRDSKRCPPRERRRLARLIRASALGWGLGAVSARRIDFVNILEATWEAMRAALGRLPVAPDLVLVDGKLPVPGLPWPQRALVGGDGCSASVAAASLLAKVARDAAMARADRRYPDYGFGRHKGYPTPAHREALARLGPCPLHRRTFRGVVPALKPRG